MENLSGSILNVQDVMDTLQIGRNHVYELLDNGDLKGFRVGHRWRIPKKCLDDYIEEKISENTFEVESKLADNKKETIDPLIHYNK